MSRPGIAHPGEHELVGAAHADELVVDEVGRHPDESEMPAPLADDLMPGRIRNEMGEPFHGHRIAVSDGRFDGLGKSEQPRHGHDPIAARHQEKLASSAPHATLAPIPMTLNRDVSDRRGTGAPRRLRGGVRARPPPYLHRVDGLKGFATGHRMRSFSYDQLPGRVVFGAGALDQLPRESICSGRAARSCSRRRSRRLRRGDARPAGRAAPASSTRRHARADRNRAGSTRGRAQLGADCAVAIGGGSTTGLGKAIALDSGLPILAIPTTYAGSEMTPIYGITEGGHEEDRP